MHLMHNLTLTFGCRLILYLDVDQTKLLAKRREIGVIDNGSGFIWHFSGLDKYLVKYLVSVGLGNKNSSYSTLDLT